MDILQILSNSLHQAFGPIMLAYALAAIGLNVHFGYTGLLNFGQAGFAAVASYGLALTVAAFNGPFWLGIVVGLLGAVVLSLLLGIPTLRLRADYLAIVTIAAAEIVRRLARSVTFKEFTGGSDGVRPIGEFTTTFTSMNPYTDSLDLGIVEFRRHELWVMTVGWLLIALCLLVMWLAMRSPWGRVLKGIREDEEAVRSLGKNVFSYKMQALVMGGIFGALGGFIYVLNSGNVQPDTFSTDFTFYFWVMLIIGGAARIFGPLLGAMIFWFLYNVLKGVLDATAALDVLPNWLINTNKSGPIVFSLLGVGMVLLLIYRPQGILGDKRELSLDVR
jgi:neutral amino acid transport system permease protein